MMEEEISEMEPGFSWARAQKQNVERKGLVVKKKAMAENPRKTRR
jgi:hypothetical protein